MLQTMDIFKRKGMQKNGFLLVPKASQKIVVAALYNNVSFWRCFQIFNNDYCAEIHLTDMLLLFSYLFAPSSHVLLEPLKLFNTNDREEKNKKTKLITEC